MECECLCSVSLPHGAVGQLNWQFVILAFVVILNYFKKEQHNLVDPQSILQLMLDTFL